MLVSRHCTVSKPTATSSLILSLLRPTQPTDAHARRSPVLTSVRHATHGAQGRANGPKNGPGKRLGAKRTNDERVVTGTIIFRQRGTQWHPGENCGVGRDHTIFALESGFVKYYMDPKRHPKRKFIGVVFNKEDTLPYAVDAVRKRRLGMVAVPRLDWARKVATDRPFSSPSATIRQSPGVARPVRLRKQNEEVPRDEVTSASARTEQTPIAPLSNKAEAVPKSKRREAWEKRLQRGKAQEAAKFRATGRLPEASLEMRPGYMYREMNWQIGRAADRAGIQRKVHRMLGERKKRFIKKRMAAAALRGKSPVRRRRRTKGKGKKK